MPKLHKKKKIVLLFVTPPLIFSFSIFTDSALLTGSVIEFPCPSVCVCVCVCPFVCTIAKHPLLEVMPTSGKIMCITFWPVMSCVTCHISQFCGPSRWRVCYQRNLPRLVSTVFCLLNSTYCLQIPHRSPKDRGLCLYSVLIPAIGFR